MNKAFVKEQDQDDPFCPRCKSLGEAVSGETLDALVRRDLRGDISAPAYLCGSAGCEVVYFDLFGRVVGREGVLRTVYPKDAGAPLCACFGLTCEDVEADLSEGGVTRTRACIDQAKSDAARCLTTSPQGRSCLATVQGDYPKKKGEWQR